MTFRIHAIKCNDYHSFIYLHSIACFFIQLSPNPVHHQPEGRTESCLAGCPHSLSESPHYSELHISFKDLLRFKEAVFLCFSTGLSVFDFLNILLLFKKTQLDS